MAVQAGAAGMNVNAVAGVPPPGGDSRGNINDFRIQ